MPRHGKGVKIKIRLYMEGVLVENALGHVQVSGHTGSPATAQLELVPTNTVKHILAGTWIHIFATDPWELEPAGDLSDFKLLFEGVVVSRGFTKADEGRSFSIQCADPSIYWVESRQFWLNVAGSNGGIVDQLAIATSGGYGRFGTVTTTGTFGYMISALGLQKSQGEERFMDTMISVIDDIGNINPFYTNVRNRFRLTDRIIRGPAGRTEQLFQLALLSDFLDGLAGRQSGQTNLAQVINQLLGAILHEWVSVPAPPYVTTRIFSRDIFGNIKRKPHEVSVKDRRGRTKVELYEFETAEDKVIGNIIFKPHVYTLAPPTCNILFPNMYDQLSYQENFMNETTRLQMMPQLPTVMGGRKAIQGTFLQRPTELEVFNAIVRDSDKQESSKRTPDAKFGDGKGQAPTFTEFDWTTNEERIRGIVYNFMNLAPAPSTLTLNGQGERTPQGGRKGGIPKYLQNVASYEYYKSKFIARQSAMAGPFNMRPVPGFPLLALDDSSANMNIISYLDSIVHDIDADGSATTSYGIKYPRYTDEVDYNRPRFKQEGKAYEGKLDYDLFKDDKGNYDFSTLFDGNNQPPIPEWFDETFRSLVDLDDRYSKWFGSGVGVVHRVLFEDASDDEVSSIKNQESERNEEYSRIGINPKKGINVEVDTPDAVAGVNGSTITVRDSLPDSLRDDVVEDNDNISLHDATMALVEEYRSSRYTGREFEQAAWWTARSFAKIDEAFKFIGAGPVEHADDGNEDSATTFNRSPASSRSVNYRTDGLKKFVGDTSGGSGYSAVVDGSASSRTSDSEEPSSANRMSGAFPVFDTRTHHGEEALNQEVRDALLTSGEEGIPSSRARYDGRPVMFDFEFRVWQDSLRKSGFSPTGERVDEAATLSKYYTEEGGQTRPATPEEMVIAAEQRKSDLAEQASKDSERKDRGRGNTNDKNMPASRQAPTGNGLEQEQREALPQPMSEGQVIDLRRSIIDAYQDELGRTRGFTG